MFTNVCSPIKKSRHITCMITLLLHAYTFANMYFIIYLYNRVVTTIRRTKYYSLQVFRQIYALRCAWKLHAQSQLYIDVQKAALNYIYMNI